LQALGLGMELPLAFLLVITAIWLASTGRLVLTGLAVGLAVIARPDTVIFAALLLLLILFEHGRSVWRTLVTAAAVLGAWTVFAAAVIGSVLPDTLTAKVDQRKSGYWGHHLYLHLLRDFYVNYPTVDRSLNEVLVEIVAVLACVGLIVGLARSRLRALTVLIAAFAGLYVFAYGVVLAVPSYGWYYVFPVGCTLVMAGIGLGELLPERWPTGGAALPVVVAVILTLLSLVRQSAPLPRYRADMQAARWVASVAPPGSSIASAEIGQLGWAVPHNEVVDYLGLLSNRAASRLAVGDLTWWVGAYQPDYWVVPMRNGQPLFAMDRPVFHAAWFPAVFRLVWFRDDTAVYERIAPAPTTT
jgi:hypothetical protein